MRTLSVRVPEEIWDALKGVDNRGEYIRRVLAQAVGVDLPTNDLEKTIERVVLQKLNEYRAWSKLR